MDRNFDDLVARFQSNVYGGLKGDIRLAVIWRDLEGLLSILRPEDAPDRAEPLRILDVGAGLGQFAIRLAALGHDVTVNDISHQMLCAAKDAAQAAGVAQNIHWCHGPYQQLLDGNAPLFDVVLCHAVVEWLSSPADLVPALKQLMKSDAYLSLAFYNRHSLEYRNLLRGNFNLLNKKEFKADPNSLTPTNPIYPAEIQQWVSAQGLRVVDQSGVRVFSDYVSTSRGGNAIPEEVLKMELAYAKQEPFLWLGRYIHMILQ